MRFKINRQPARIKRMKKQNDKREWHTKFAWVPTTVDETTKNYNKVWLEKYWRQGRWGPSKPGRENPMIFTKYSNKEYFKKKLNGDFDKEEIGDTVSLSGMSITAPAPSTNKMIKKGGPYDATAKYKRNII